MPSLKSIAKMSELLQELNGFSLKITQAIELDDWEQLSVILMQRQARLETLLNAPLSEDDQHTIQGVLKSVQAMDTLFVETVQLKKNELLKDFRTVARGQKSILAYYAP
jgi:hypothetical protein